MKNQIIITIIALTLCACGFHSEIQLTKSGLNPQNFATDSTALYTLTNASGMEACITNYGGRVVSLLVPDSKSEMVDVVFGYDNIDDYIKNDGHFGALIGPYGNRINNGRFTLDGIEYQLPQNNGRNCLHGGNIGFHNKVWNAEQTSDSTLALSLYCPDGQDGFPGNRLVNVIYTLTADNSLDIDYSATTDKPTVINLTNHSYFNLGKDHGKTITDHVLTINADGYTPVDDDLIPTGEISDVNGTPFDFRTVKAIGRDINADDSQIKKGPGYDHNFVLNQDAPFAAEVYNPENGIVMTVITSEPGIQFYAGNFLDGTVVGKNEVAYPYRSAFCLETQHFPDSPNNEGWPSTRLDPGQTYSSHTSYRFSVK